VRERGETWAVDPEMREAFDRLGADLRGEIWTSAAEGRVYVDGAIQASAAETRAYIGERFQTSEAETRAYVDERIQASTASLLHEIRESESRMRRHFDVVGESLRADNRSVAEGRVLRLEVRVSGLEDDRKPRRSRRRR
jgi:hypothetical protein